MERKSERVCSNLFPPGIKAVMGYRLGRRLMIPLAAVFAGILQHSHSTGFRSGATARIISRPLRSAASAAGSKSGAVVVVGTSRPMHLELHRALILNSCWTDDDALFRFRVKRHDFNSQILNFSCKTSILCHNAEKAQSRFNLSHFIRSLI